MSNLPQEELNEKELLEILELAKEAEESIKQLCQMVAKHNYKWRKRIEARQKEKTEQLKS
ncbi:hypothetical protein PCC7424_2195 [Gloeothece citriformis PCC 7424]|uniref:Uncharacterized protein n=1 Tax=Gloeothece citriformis (strain PCC 7424) TaxID=65393 RepID=B7KGE6_GLOC7|nr:hypothetical protein [Gloeothece citriformis]ACK70617.1 hypothetical protein PCC7424_2195 [Gloeothece citriformis PCC 7424]